MNSMVSIEVFMCAATKLRLFVLGPVVRMSPNLLCFNDPTRLPEVYHRHSEKTPFYSPGMAGEKRPLLQIQGDLEHAAQLKIIGPTVGFACA